MQILILTEGGCDIGLGHIGRCVGLCQAFKQKGLFPRMIVNGDSSAKKLLHGINHTIFDWINDEGKLEIFLRQVNIVVIDSYLAGILIYKKVSGKIKIPAYIDDNKRLNYPAGIVVNGASYGAQLTYPEKKGKTYLLGPKYALLRREFWTAPAKKIHKGVKTMMLAFGGSDFTGMTVRVLEMALGNFPDIFKYVIIGPAFKEKKQIKKYKDRNIKLIYGSDAKMLKTIMSGSDIAISAGGQMLHELARMGVPTIAIAVARNQYRNVREGQRAGYLRYAGSWNKKSIITDVGFHLRQLIQEQNLRERMSRAGQRQIDGQGAIRTVEAILNRAKDAA